MARIFIFSILFCWLYLAFPMVLKYQKEIDDFDLRIQCPQNVTPISADIYAYRFCFDPIGHPLNFLPNVVFDRKKPAYFNYGKADPSRKCRRCGASFYLNKSLAINNWNGLSNTIRNNLGYTHIAYGVLQKGDGLITEPEGTSHFCYYESTSAKLTLTFKVMDVV